MLEQAPERFLEAWVLKGRNDDRVVITSYSIHYTKLYELYPAVKETLSTLKNAGFEMAVVTNKPDAFVQPLLKAAGIADYFSYTLGGGILPVHKPAPEPLFYLCDKFDVQPNQALMVGDSKNDIEAARAAGMRNNFV